MAINSVAGNVFSDIYGAAKNLRDSGYRIVEIATDTNTANANTTYFACKVPAFPGNVKLSLVSATYANGRTNSVLNAANTATFTVRNLTNANDVMASYTLVAAGVTHVTDTTNFAAQAFTLTTNTSDRSSVAGMTSTEPDYNAAPGDTLIVNVASTDANTNVKAGGVFQLVFKPVDVTA